MHRMLRRTFLLALGALALSGCANGLGPDTHSDIDRARIDWLRQRPASYSFELTARFSMTGSRTYDITVRDGVVVESINHAGTREFLDLSIDRIWDTLLKARQDEEINSVKFDDRGVPLETDIGEWALDGGFSYAVRNFRRL